MRPVFKKLIFLFLVYIFGKFLLTDYFIKTYVSVSNRVKTNYGEQVDELCEEMNLPAAYFKALIVLECGGNKPAKTRFEQGVFDQLKLVRQGDRAKYGYITPAHLKGIPDETLRLLASSWGPLQIMGYHCFELGIGIDQLRGDNGLRWAMVWCEKNYGKFLHKGQYKDAFHMHNAGKPFPVFGCTSTHDPQYVYRGMKYMDVFD